jgi:hypothetical protein
VNPRKRDEGLLVKPIADETVVYDIERLRAHSLEPLAARIWAACDGDRGVEEIADRVSAELGQDVPADVVLLTLRRLERADLMATRQPRMPSLSCSRRALMTRVAALGGLAVFSTVLPTPAQAATLLPDGSVCTLSSECASGCCCQDVTVAWRCRPPVTCAETFLSTCAPG